MRYNKWTTICKNKMSLLKQVYCAIKQGCLFYDCVRGLYAQLEFGFHNASDNALRQGFAAGELINLCNHLTISHPFIFQILGFIIVHVMCFGNPVQPVDAGIPTGQSFFQMGAGSHILIAGPMKFNARLVEEVLHIK